MPPVQVAGHAQIAVLLHDWVIPVLIQTSVAHRLLFFQPEVARLPAGTEPPGLLPLTEAARLQQAATQEQRATETGS